MRENYAELKEQYKTQFSLERLGKNRKYLTYTDCAEQIRQAYVSNAYQSVLIEQQKSRSFSFNSFCKQVLPINLVEDALIDLGMEYSLTPSAVLRLYLVGAIGYERQEGYVFCLKMKENSSFQVSTNEIWDPKVAPAKSTVSPDKDYERSSSRLKEAIHTEFHNTSPESAEKIARRFLSANPNAQVTEVIANLKNNQYKISQVDGESYLVDAVAISRPEPEATQPEQPKEVQTEKPQAQTISNGDNRNMVHIDKAGVALSQDILRVAIAYILVSALILSLTNIIMMPLAYQAIIFLIITPLIAAKIVEKIFGWQTMEVVRR